MAFTIFVRNDGDTATVRVFQRINLNETANIFENIVESGARVSVQAMKTDDDGDMRGEFIWEHEGSKLTDQEYVNAGDELRVK